MEKSEWLQKAAQSIVDMDEEVARDLAQKSIEAGIDPLEMINAGFTEGIRKMGNFFAGIADRIRCHAGGGRDPGSRAA